MDEDIEFINLYLSGEEEALERLVMKYQKRVYGIAYRMTNDIEESKDLAQKTFLNVFRNIRGFRGDASFKTWLYQIAVNTTLNHVRQNRHVHIELDESFSGNQQGALSAAIEKEQVVVIRKGVHGLPERQRLALILRVYEGLSCIETAQVMGCTEGAVKAHYHNAVKSLKTLVQEKGYEIKS